MSEIRRQRKEALAALSKTTVVMARFRKLLKEQDTYIPAAFEESANTLMRELNHAERRFFGRMSILVAMRCGRVEGQQSE